MLGTDLLGSGAVVSVGTVLAEAAVLYLVYGGVERALGPAVTAAITGDRS